MVGPHDKLVRTFSWTVGYGDNSRWILATTFLVYIDRLCIFARLETLNKLSSSAGVHIRLIYAKNKLLDFVHRMYNVILNSVRKTCDLISSI